MLKVTAEAPAYFYLVQRPVWLKLDSGFKRHWNDIFTVEKSYEPVEGFVADQGLQFTS